MANAANASGGNNSSSSRKDSLQPAVPRSASAASAQIRRAVQTALVSGKRRMVVDVLLADIDPRQRTYDERSAREVYFSLASCGTLLSSSSIGSGSGNGSGSVSSGREERGGTHMVVSGATTAMRVRSWIQSSTISTISTAVAGDGGDNNNTMMTTRSTTTIGILGTKESKGLAQRKNLVVFMVDPDGGVKGLVDLRRALRAVIGGRGRQQVFPGDAQKNTAVVICNHPREGRLHEAVGYDGPRPVEMLEFEDIFVLIPFSVMHRSPDAPRDEMQQVRFVLMKQFPWKWGFWVFVKEEMGDGASSEGNGSVRDDDYYERNGGMKNNGNAAVSEHGRGEYVLFREFEWRPDDGDIDEAIRESLSELID